MKCMARVVFLLSTWVLSAALCDADTLASHFKDPPREAGIRAFWWWLNGNVTEGAITRDLEEMRAKGFSGALIFDADGSSQRGNQRVPAGPVFAGPDWTRLFVHACREAKRLDLELSLNLQSGWNLGGPEVSEEEATQRLVWSSTPVTGPGAVEQVLPRPVKNGRFYRDVAVLAVPLPTAAPPDRSAVTLDASSHQKAYPPIRAMDGNPDTFWVSQDPPDPAHPQWLLLTLPEPASLAGLSLRGRPGYGPREGEVQVSEDKATFHKVQAFSLKDGETLHLRFEARKASFVRLVFTAAHDPQNLAGKARNVQVAEVVLPVVGAPVWAGKAAAQPIRDLPLKSSTRELGMSAPDCRFLLNTTPALPGEPFVARHSIVDLSGRMNAEGTLRWKAPAGGWVILRIGHTATGAHVSTQSEGWGGRVLDYLNPRALQAYWDRNIEPLMEAIGPLAGTTLRYVHTDSWEGGGMNWTPGFDRTFRENRGYDPIPWLAVLAGHVVESREDSNAFLADFRKTIADRVADHYGELARLAGKHGMGTHPECSGPHAGPLDGLKNYGRSELMMSEFWSPSPHRPKPDNRFYVKQAASAAHTYGKRLVGAEAFTTIGPHWNDVFWSAMKPSFDHEFCAGLNLVFNHTFTCSPEAMGLPGQEYFAGTHFNPQVTWWEEAPAFIGYMNRCQALAQRGSFVADVLYYYGDHIPNIFGRKGHDPAGALPGYDYDVLSEELLLSGLAVEDGRLTLPSGMQYRVLVLPDHRVLSLGALKKIDTLVRAGATVLGPKPLKAVSLEGGDEGKTLFKSLSDSLWGAEEQSPGAKGSRSVGPGRVAWGLPARAWLREAGLAPDLVLAGTEGDAITGLDWIHYRVGEAEVYFLAELEGRVKPFEANFRIHGRLPELWDPVDGSIREAAAYQSDGKRTWLPLLLDAYESLFVVFRKPAAERGRDDGLNWKTWTDVQEIAGPWDVSFDPKWGGPAEPLRFATLVDWLDHEDRGVRFYSGRAVYKTTFELKEKLAGQPLALALTDVRDVGIARVKLNGADLGTVWRPPFRVDIGPAARSGTNVLEVAVVSSWHNRVMGDDMLPEQERHTRTNIRVEKKGRFKWELEPSGLLGPVTLQRETGTP